MGTRPKMSLPRTAGRGYGTSRSPNPGSAAGPDALATPMSRSTQGSLRTPQKIEEGSEAESTYLVAETPVAGTPEPDADPDRPTLPDYKRRRSRLCSRPLFAWTSQ